MFLGASYFRALGRGQRYGLSARGVAIDTGLPKEEEFPMFRAFWLESPTPNSARSSCMRCWTVQRDRRLRFRIRPGVSTTMESR